MKRILSQRTMCSKGKVLLNTAIETDENGVILKLISISEGIFETSRTVFYNGIITPGIVSISKRSSLKIFKEISGKYNVFNLEEIISGKIPAFDSRPLLIDLKSENPEIVSQIFKENMDFFRKITIFDIITSMVFHPAEALAVKNEIDIGEFAKLILWPSPESIEARKDFILNVKQI